MLVIVSDLHMTDGTTGLRVSAGAFRTFQERLESMAYDASKREGDRYEPLRELDLVLLGDIFDVLRSTQWAKEAKGEAGYARPWSAPEDPALANKLEAIVDSILLKNAESLVVLRSLADGSGISLPPPTAGGEVDRRVSRDHRSKQRLPVKVNIYYMNGNHDWLLHLPGERFNAIRQKIVTQMGLCNPPTPFPYAPEENPALQYVFRQHQAYGRHGDLYDPMNYVKGKGRNYSCLGDAMVVELFNPLPVAIERELGGELPPAFFSDLAEMGSIRPQTMSPVWVAGLLERHQAHKKHRQAVDAIWKDLVERFLKLDFLDELDKIGFDVVDAVQILLTLFRGVSLDSLASLAPTVEKLLHFQAALSGGSEAAWDEHAYQEAACQSGEARFIVYGHTHGCKVVPLRTQFKDDQPFDQLYLNSGTWHILHELGKFDPAQRGFMMHKSMSYLGFYRQDERKGRRFETWTGTLAV